METMIVSLSNFKTLKELTQYIIKVKNNQIIRWCIENAYGSFEKFEKMITDEWIKINCNKAAEESTTTKEKKLNDNLNMEQKIIRDTIKQVKKNEYKNKKCKIINGRFKEFKGIIRDDCELLDKYLIQLENDELNAIYVDKKDVEIIEQWKDIILEGYDKDLKDYSITIKQDKIIVESYTDDIYTYEVSTNSQLQERIINNLKNEKNKNSVIEYILNRAIMEKTHKEYKEVNENIKRLENKEDELSIKYIKADKLANSLLKGLA